jgi:hypothetical protein
MKKNILKKINPPSFDSFLRNLGRFLVFENRIYSKTLKSVIIDVDFIILFKFLNYLIFKIVSCDKM